MFEQLDKILRDRLDRKIQRAEGAFIKAQTSKETRNCRNCGPNLSGGIYVCKVSCSGMDARSAGQCFNSKAQGCDEFTLKRSPEALRTQFRKMPQGELVLRWPQIGELLWVLKELNALQKSQEE